MNTGFHIASSARIGAPATRGLLLLSCLWACPRVRPLGGDQHPRM